MQAQLPKHEDRPKIVITKHTHMKKTLAKVINLKAAFEGDGADSAVNSLDLDGKSRLHDVAYKQLRQALMDGRIVPGQVFSLRTLAQVFGTSPIPVRDALKRLVAEHALELRPNRSVVLPHMSRARFQEILQVRLALEPMIASRGVSRITAQEIEAMAADHAEMCAAVERRDATAYLAANRRFHFRLYSAANTHVMLPIVEGLWMQVGPHLHQIFMSQKQATAVADHHHVDVLRALRRQDAPAVAKAVWEDLSDAADEILTSNLFKEEKV
jgi:DNA-binding GntR family transcriptional regulator